MSHDHDGTPQPQSQPMTKETAMWYVQHTQGQLQAFLHADGNWYLYAPKPIEVPDQLPTVRSS